MVAIVTKLKSVDRSKIDNESVINLINRAVADYENLETLTEVEEKNCNAIYDICDKKFPESVGKKPKEKKAKEPEIAIPDEEELLSFLSEKKKSRKV